MSFIPLCWWSRVVINMVKISFYILELYVFLPFCKLKTYVHEAHIEKLQRILQQSKKSLKGAILKEIRNVKFLKRFRSLLNVFFQFQEEVVFAGPSVVKSPVRRSRLFPRFQFLSLDNEEGGEERNGFLSNLKKVSKENGDR